VTNIAGNVTTMQGQITNINGKLADAVMYDSSAHNSVTLGGTGASSNVKLSNVAAGTLSSTSTDAVNGAQLYATNNNVTSVTNTVNNIVNGGGIKYFHTNSSLGDSVATGTNSTAIGPVATAGAANAIAIGNGANASTANSVALGNGATTAAAVATPNGVIGGTTYTYAGTTPTGVVSMGAAGAERQVTNVAAGQVTSSSTDAVHGSQLYATNKQVTKNTGDISNIYTQLTNLSGGAIDAVMYDSSAHDSVTLGGSGASSAVALHNVAAGEVSASSLDAVNGSQLYATNTNVSNLAGTVTNIAGDVSNIAGNVTTLQGQMADAVSYDTSAHDSITLGGTDATTPVAIHNVKDGDVSASSTDAVNGAQLYATNTNVSNLAGDVTNLAGDITSISGKLQDAVLYDTSAHDSVTLGGSGASSAVALHNVKDGDVSASSTDAVNGSQLYATNTNVSNLAGTVTNIAGDVSNIAGNVTTLQGQMADAVSYDTSAHDSVTLGGSGASSAVALHNVKDGDVSASSTDAVNGSQLYATNTNVSNLAGTVTNIAGDVSNIAGNVTTLQGQMADAVSYDSSAHDSITLGGTDATTPVAIHNVKDGDVSASSTDAVNGAQLYATNTNVSNLAGDVTNLAGDITSISGKLQDAVLYDSSAHDSVTLGGSGASSAVALHNVKDGDVSASSTDAVNGSQLYATNTNVSNLTGTVTNIAGNVTTMQGQITNINGKLA
ncbi:beta strand repeat-containing protein, partial [Paraburkholderia tropica]|uniref:beta strand repeat-containing protein n=1 Tax=Paraburkholderia tropica TaxID=92647 RepID=UPI003F552935